MNNQEIELTKDPLTNIHLMAPLLDKEGRKSACTFMLGLMVGAGSNKKPTDNKDRTDHQSG